MHVPVCVCRLREFGNVCRAARRVSVSPIGARVAVISVMFVSPVAHRHLLHGAARVLRVPPVVLDPVRVCVPRQNESNKLKSMGNPFSKATEDPGNECPKSSSSTPNGSSPRMDSSAPTSMNIFGDPIVSGDSQQSCGKPVKELPRGNVQPGLNMLASAKPPQLQVVPNPSYRGPQHRVPQ